MHIFISYAKKDTRDLAIKLRDTMRDIPNVTVWVDESIEPGSDWDLQIEDQIDLCDLFVVLLSPDVNRREGSRSFVINEIQHAIEGAKTILPVLAMKTRIPLIIKSKQYIDFTNDNESGIQRLLKEVKNIAEHAPQKLTTTEISVTDILPEPFEWCAIPAGKVDIKGHGFFDVTSFSMAKYPITVAQYAVFVNKGGYDQPSYWTGVGWEWRQQENITAPRYWNIAKWHKSDHPIVGVSWYEALAFCRWLSNEVGRNILLPTEQQWQRAAMGHTDQKYAWGNSFDPNYCNSSVGSESFGTTPVMKYQNGVSPYGVMDMTGNVWEWTLTDRRTVSSQDLDTLDARVVRGGSWGNLALQLLNTARGGEFPTNGANNLGFRCARND